jgi:hypothetical protein
MGINTDAGNQYATKVYEEHPIALWSLDEDAFYLSLIDDNDRKFTNWTLTACTASNSPTIPDEPADFPDSIYSSLEKSSGTAGTITAISSNTFQLSDIDTEITTFCVNFWLYHQPTYVNWFKFGYQYTHATLGTQTILSDPISPATISSWLNFNQVYEIPDNWTGYIKLIIMVDFDATSTASERTVIMNGLSVGQNSQNTCFVSLGSTREVLPDEIDFVDMEGISADEYGVNFNNGYYLIKGNKLLAKNDVMPIIYGTNNSTNIYPSGTDEPSFIFPGKGMLYENGRNKQYTLEMWVKLDPLTSVAKKIIGPINSNDGIWVKDGFITLVVGNEIGSHCVGEWYRPMLVHFIINSNNVALLINGEEVINMTYDRENIDLPSTQDWWGVYSYTSFNMFHIDTISIFPYQIAEIVAKKRFVYGQGAPSVQTLDSSFGGTPITIDFSTSEYSANTIYPDIARWDAGYFNNLSATRNYIAVPNYSLPTIYLGSRDIYEWYSDNYIVNTLDYPDVPHPNFVTFRPNITYDINSDPVSWSTTGTNYTESCYFNFPSLNILTDPVVAVYGIFEIESNISSERTLMSFVNNITGTSFNIVIFEDEVRYIINGEEIHSDIINIGEEALVGLNFSQAGSHFGYAVSQFFASPSSIQLYIGGNGQNTFEGKIYDVGFCNQINYQEIEAEYPNNEVFMTNGLTDYTNFQLLFNHIASYTLIPEYEYNKFYMDISVSSRWEEYFPLTQFAGYVRDENGDLYYDLDLMQVNVGYTYAPIAQWTYEELGNAFIYQTYADLNASYNTYFDLKMNNGTTETVGIPKSSLRSYITFQSIADGANKPLSDFTYTKSIPDNYVIDADLETYPYDTKFEFVDNTIVYAPKDQNFEDYAMVVHFYIKQRSIIKNPLKIRNLEITSKNFNYVDDQNTGSYVGTKFGTKVYPEIVKTSGLDYKDKNPYLIYKTNTPYTYTTKKSGIEVVNKYLLTNPSTSNQYRISIPINKVGSDNFSIGAIKFFMLGKISDSDTDVSIMEIKHSDGTLSLILNNTDAGMTFSLYNKGDALFLDGGSASTQIFTETVDAGDSTDNFDSEINITMASSSIVEAEYEELSGFSFYQNGKYVKNPIINNYEWNHIGIVFPSSLDFSQYTEGAISLLGGFVFNNVSYYLTEGLGIQTDISLRVWENVYQDDIAAAVGDGTYVTYTTTIPHPLAAGQSVKITGSNPSQYNFTGTVYSVIDEYNFKVSSSATGAYVGSGVLTYIWSDWSQKKWSDVYAIGRTSSYISTPEDIFNVYAGTNRNVIDDDSGISLTQIETVAINSVSWSVYSGKPA